MGNQEEQESGFKVWWDEENKIIRQKSWGINDKDLALEIVAAELEELKKHPGVGLLVDGSEVPIMTPDASVVFKRAITQDEITYVAFLKPTGVMMELVNVILSFMKNQFRFFNDEEKAIRWLQKKTESQLS